MIKLRLKRFGKKREVSYRIVAMKSTSRRDGRPLEELGYYNPRTDETRLEVPGIIRRLQQGAQPTPTVRRILEKASVFEQLKTGVIPQAETQTTSEPAAAPAPEAADPAPTASSEEPERVEETEPSADTEAEVLQSEA